MDGNGSTKHRKPVLPHGADVTCQHRIVRISGARDFCIRESAVECAQAFIESCARCGPESSAPRCDRGLQSARLSAIADVCTDTGLGHARVPRRRGRAGARCGTTTRLRDESTQQNEQGGGDPDQNRL